MKKPNLKRSSLCLALALLLCASLAVPALSFVLATPVWAATDITDSFTDPNFSAVASGYCGNPQSNDGQDVTWTLDSDGVLTISGNGAMDDYTSSGYDIPPYAAYVDSITSVIIENGVTTIGNYAFCNFRELSSVTIANTVTEIRCGAFATYGIGNKITELTIPDSVTSIDLDAFINAAALETLNLGASARFLRPDSLGHSFGGSLKNINVSATNPYYSSENGILFNKNKTTLLLYPVARTDISYTVPNTVTTIASGAFTSFGRNVNAIALKTLILPDSVTALGASQDGGKAILIQLDELIVGAGITSIAGGYGSHGPSRYTVSENNANYSSDGNGVLFDKSKTQLLIYPQWAQDNLESYTIPDTVVIVADGAFTGTLGTYALKSLEIGAALTKFESANGSDNTWIPNLESITVNSANTAYLSENGILFDKGKTKLVRYPANKSGSTYTVPEGVTSLAGGAFSQAKNLTSIVLPETLTSVGEYAFWYCENLETLNIPATLTDFSSWMETVFLGCDKLMAFTVADSNGVYCVEDGVLFSADKTTLVKYPVGKSSRTYTIPDGITNTSRGAFSYAAKLKKLTFPESLITSGGTYPGVDLSIAVFKSQTPPNIANYIYPFNDDTVTAYVPASAVAAYSNVNYGQYFKEIVGYSDESEIPVYVSPEETHVPEADAAVAALNARYESLGLNFDNFANEGTMTHEEVDTIRSLIVGGTIYSGNYPATRQDVCRAVLDISRLAADGNPYTFSDSAAFLSSWEPEYLEDVLKKGY
ncbi:MAG: leucine-rich repeat domain-containing protein [Oscillospiraceae bacterium]|jgi:hypothetical protein|nr:leucine-rich repeat domain-containing protein [Oscillospiraceae bacterium]